MNTTLYFFEIASPNTGIAPITLTNLLKIPVHASYDLNDSGVAYVSLYYQTNGGSFTRFGDFKTYDTVEFHGVNGNVYGFYSIVVDSTWNEEQLKTNQ